MDQTSWMAWPLWMFIGTVAQVVSLVAIVLALYELDRRRRGVRSVVWRFDPYGVVSVEGGKAHAVEICNAGTGTALLFELSISGARPILSEAARVPTVFGPGERATVHITAPKIAEAWAFVAWRGSDDSRTYYAAWFPLNKKSALHERWQDAHLELRRRPRWRELYEGHHPRAVGPEHSVRTRVKSSRNPVEMDRRWAQVRSEYKKSTLAHALPTHDVSDLPVVPLD